MYWCGSIFVHWTWHLLGLSNLETHILQLWGNFLVLFIWWFSPFHLLYFFSLSGTLIIYILALLNSSLSYFFLLFPVFCFSRSLLISRFLHPIFQSFYWVSTPIWYSLNSKFVFRCSFWASLGCWLDFIDSGLYCQGIWLAIFCRIPSVSIFGFFSWVGQISQGSLFQILPGGMPYAASILQEGPSNSGVFCRWRDVHRVNF